MPSSSPSSPLLLLLLLLRPAGAAEDCGGGSFRSAKDNFVLDAEDGVKAGAEMLSSSAARSADDCERACCAEPRCNVALLEPRGSGAAAAGAAAADSRTCVLFDCVHRNRFVCRFVNQAGYRTFIRESVYRKHLQGPQGGGEQPPPPIAIAGRDVIVQPGEEVTLSGIESLALGDAHITDYRWSLESGDRGVKMEDTDLHDQVRLSHLQPGRYVFQLSVTDSNDQSHASKVSVLVLGPDQTSSYCRAAVKVGPCRAAFPRWHYNAAAGNCDMFMFGGCKQNNNNFLSEAECLSACRGVSVTSERSVSPPAECGVACRPGQLTCGGCCLDRGVECDGVKQCEDGSDEDHCHKLNQTFSRLLDIDVNQKKARCAEPPHTGPCRASFTRWYYDPINTRCARFTYGGCDANDNNFEDEDTCADTCRGVTERSVFFKQMFDRYETDDDSDSGNIALAVLLSVAILALLAILAYCFLRSRKKRSHRPAATGPAHVSLSEQDTLVYNSTTKPV